MADDILWERAVDILGNPSTVYGGVDPLGVAEDNFNGLYPDPVREALSAPIRTAGKGIQRVFESGFERSRPDDIDAGWQSLSTISPYTSTVPHFDGGRHVFYLPSPTPSSDWRDRAEPWRGVHREKVGTRAPVDALPPGLERLLSEEVIPRRAARAGKPSDHGERASELFPPSAGAGLDRAGSDPERDISRLLELMDRVAAPASNAASETGSATGGPKSIDDLIHAIPNRKP